MNKTLLALWALATAFIFTMLSFDVRADNTPGDDISCVKNCPEAPKTLALEKWALAAITSKAPPSIVSKYAAKGHEETEQEVLKRYTSIARDAVSVGKTKSNVSLLLGIALHESGFQHDVDIGPCARTEHKGPYVDARCDHGRAACIMQVRTDVHNHTAAELFADRQLCFRIGLKVALSSKASCAKKEPALALQAYAGGSCGDVVTSTMPAIRSRELMSYVDKFANFVR